MSFISRSHVIKEVCNSEKRLLRKGFIFRVSGSGKIDEYKSQTKRDEKYHQNLVQYDISGFNFTHQTHSIENLTTGHSISLASSFDDLLGSACDQCPTKHKAISQIRRKKYLLNFSIQLCFFLFQFADFFWS